MSKFGKWFHPSDHVEVIKECYKTSIRITSNSAKFPPKYLLNTSLEHYHYSNMLVFVCVLVEFRY